MSDTTTQTLDRQVGGQPFPAAGTYLIDQSHSTIQAIARHLMVSKVRGGFSSFTGTIVVAEEPTDSTVEVSIDAASIDTREEQRDGHLRSADFLDVENHPQLTFRSTSIDPRGKVTGDLTIRGITKPVTLDVDYLGTFKNPFGQTVAAFSGGTKLNRENWEITWNAPLEAGGVLLGRELTIELEIQAALQEDE